MVRTTAEIALEIDQLKARFDATAAELEAKVPRVPRSVGWLTRHARRVAIVAALALAAALLVRAATRDRD